MDGKSGAIEADHGLGHKLGAPGQLEHRVRYATPNSRKFGISALSSEIPRPTLVAEVTPEHQPPSLYGSDLHEPAEILPDENGTFVGRGDQRNLQTSTISD
jgi:hypothetical protein